VITNSSSTNSKLPVLYALPFPHFFSQFGGIGGHVAHAHGILKALNFAGADLDVLAEEKPNEKVDFVRSWTSLPCTRTSPFHRFFWNKNFVKQISELVQKNNYSFCYLRYSTQFSLFLPALKRALGSVPLVLELNSFGAQHGTIKQTILTPMEARGIKAADLTLCVSNSLMDDVTRLLGRKTSAKCFVVPNGVDPERFTVSYDRQGDKKLPASLCYCGVLKPGYGLESLLEAHGELEEKFKGISLHIIGEGPHRSILESYPGRGRNVVFHGAVAFHKVPELLARMEILVYTTAPHNTFQSPIKLYEYMCTGRPIAAAETPQVRQVLDGINPSGMLFRLNDKSSFKETIHSLLDDPNFAKQLAETARNTVEAEHTWNQRVTSLLSEMSVRGIFHE